jgi:predicted RNase H-like HicB family nuclease
MLRVTIHPGEDGLWIAECPALPGCKCKGTTRRHAAKIIRHAIELYIDALETAEDLVAVRRSKGEPGRPFEEFLAELRAEGRDV